MKKNIAVYLLLAGIVSNYYNLKSYDASVSIKLSKTNIKPLTNKTFGIFTEFLRDYINGSNGIWAQELYDRGFDMNYCGDWAHLCYWNEIRSSDSSKIGFVGGGYNPNGNFSQKLTNYSENSYCGFSQDFLATDTVGYDFSIHYKGTGGSLIMRLVADNLSDSCEYILGTPGTDWAKASVRTRAVKNGGKLTLKIIYRGIGECEIDETSVMQSDNFMGIRREYYELFKKWNMGIWRYPGGTFADMRTAHWKYGIGELDRRNAPNYLWEGELQRMDFGTIEYLNFCKIFKIEPHITVNYQNGTPEEAAEWVEFTNGDTTTFWGKKRAELGYPEPFKVKYWEIGNEQWEDHQAYANGYLKFYNKMKSVDPSIYCISDGNIWDTENTMNAYINVINNKMNVYGYHDFLVAKPDSGEKEQDRFVRSLSSDTPVENNLKMMAKKLGDNSLFPEITIANTEWSVLYNNFPIVVDDTDQNTKSLGAGLASATWYLVFMRNPDLIGFTEKVIGISTIKRTINSHGKRSIYGNCSYLAVSMLSNHFGENIALTTVDAPIITQPWYNSPFLSVTSTYSKDTLYIDLLNKSNIEPCRVNFSTDSLYYGSKIKYYQLYSANYQDMVTPDNPNFIKIMDYDSTFTQKMSFPPNSLTVIAIPYSKVDIEPINNSSEKFKLFQRANSVIITPIWSTNNYIIEIYDILGNSVFHQEQDFSSGIPMEINTERFISGFYLIKISNSNYSSVKKIIIEH